MYTMGMSEYNARIFHADDTNVVLQSFAALAPFELGNVVLQAHTIDEALGYIPDTLRGRGVNMAIIDDNFNDRERRTGVVIAQAIRDSGLAVAIISLSANTQNWGDLNCKKEDSPSKMAASIRQRFPHLF